MKFVRRAYYKSPKAGTIFCDSSYELKAATILDSDESVLAFEKYVEFTGISGKKRKTDFIVTYKDGIRKLIEVKPKRRLVEFSEQIEDNKHFANSNGMDFMIWTETELGFNNEDEAKAWADEYHKTQTGTDYAALRRECATKRSKKHYKKHIATDTVQVQCAFCNTTHTALRLTYDKNIAKNGRYICEREGGHIAGSRPKPHLIKVNPYAAEGKKQCNKCQRILPLELFYIDKSKRDGYRAACRECRPR